MKDRRARKGMKEDTESIGPIHFLVSFVIFVVSRLIERKHHAPTEVTPCLWFDDQAEEAVNFYVSLIPNSR